METLKPAELHALKIVAKDCDKVRNLLVDGSKIPLDFGVHINGELIVNNGQEYSAPVKAPPELIIAALLSYFGPRKRSKIVEEVLDSGLTQAVKDPEQTKALAEELMNGLTTRTLTKRRGAVTGNFNVTPVHVRS